MNVCVRKTTELTLDSLELEELMSQEPELIVEVSDVVRIKPASSETKIKSITIDFESLETERIQPTT